MLRESRSRPLAQFRNSSGGVAPETAAAKISVRVMRFDVAYAPKLWPHRPNLPLVKPISRTVFTAGTTHFSNESAVWPTFTLTLGISIAYPWLRNIWSRALNRWIAGVIFSYTQVMTGTLASAPTPAGR